MSKQVSQPERDGGFTVAPISAPENAAGIFPEFCRVPRKHESCKITGLRRSQIYELINSGLVKSVSLRKKGKVKGTRLLVTSSLLGYLRDLASQQNTPRAQGGASA